MARADIGDVKKIPIADFQKLQLRVGTIVRVRPHPKSKKHYCLLIDNSAADEDLRVVAELAQHYDLADLIGKQVCVLVNLPPQVVMGEDSDAVLLVSHVRKKPVLIGPLAMCAPGTFVSALSDKLYNHTPERR